MPQDDQGRQVRVRFAPSPTGWLHVGGARTALFNWLYARHHGGTFVLRIEDTDVTRSTEEATNDILASMRWLGLDWDEGPEVGGPYAPYFQMQRLDRYRQYLDRLVASGHAYPCFCSVEELAAEREAAKAAKLAYKYSRRCRGLTVEERTSMLAAGQGCIYRFAAPETGETIVHDLIRGDVRFENAQMEDLVLVKSDGVPTYNFAVVVDDATMRISHVIRGEDHLSNTPKQILLYQALGEPAPQFAHVPLILGPDKTRLSKRHGATSLDHYAQEGYLPEALMNFLALLGWSYDESTEVFSKEDLVEKFSLDRVGKTPAVFSLDKLQWMNGLYIRGLSVDGLTARVLPFLAQSGLVDVADAGQVAYVRSIVPLVQERLKRLAEMPELSDFFFAEELSYDPHLLVEKKMDAVQAHAALWRARQELAGLVDFSVEPLEHLLRGLTAALGLKTGTFFGLLRVAITGRTVAPPLFQTMHVLGKERVLGRLDRAMSLLSTL